MIKLDYSLQTPEERNQLVEQINTINRVNDNNKNLAILKDYDGNKEERKEQNNENK